MRFALPDADAEGFGRAVIVGTTLADGNAAVVVAATGMVVAAAEVAIGALAVGEGAACGVCWARNFEPKTTAIATATTEPAANAKTIEEMGVRRFFGARGAVTEIVRLRAWTSSSTL